MRHNKDRKSLNRTASHRKAMLSNMVISLFRRGRIKTTRRKAKEARRVAERMITYAKKGDLASRRQAAKVVKDKQVLRKLFDKIGPRFEDRNGGYTRIFKLTRRNGDNTEMAMLEILSADEKKRSKKKSRKKYYSGDIPEDPVKLKKRELEAEEQSKKKEAEKKAKAAEEKEAEEEKKQSGDDKEGSEDETGKEAVEEKAEEEKEVEGEGKEEVKE